MERSDYGLLRVEGAGVAYPAGGIFSRHRYWALEEVSFALHEGEAIGVIGRNGAGKSTLLKLLAGIIAPDRGRVWRKPGARASLLALQVGFLQDLTGWDNAILSCVLLGMTRRDAIAKLPRIVEFAELHDAIDNPLSTYSSGMRARLGFGVALASEPDILLIDEVLGVGDAVFRKKSSSMLEDRIRSGQSTIVVSHSIGTLKNLCSKLVVIEQGRNVMAGPTAEVAAQYETHIANLGRPH